jgi:hypothetical protein
MFVKPPGYILGSATISFSSWAEKQGEKPEGLSCYCLGKCRNAEKIVIPASAFLPAVNCANPASAFRHQGQSAGHGIAWTCPGLVKS